MTSLIISLPLVGPDAAELYDYVLSSDGLTPVAHASVPLALLPTTHDEVVALVPAQALSWHQVKLPVGSVPRVMSGERASARLRSILDGALEDQLLDDPAQLHLALQPRPALTPGCGWRPVTGPGSRPRSTPWRRRATWWVASCRSSRRNP